MNKSKIQSLPLQRGFATILVVLLVGLALSASVLGTAYYLRSSQSSLVSAHALTNVQSGAWNGVEIVRGYLEKLTTSQELLALNGQTLTISKPSGTNSGSLSAVINNVEQNGTTYLITATITNISNASKASSKVQVTYEVNLASGGTSTIVDTTTINAIDIYGDLTVGGGIEIKGGKNAVINVHGNVNTTGTSFTGVSELNVTGDVILAGGGEVITKIVSNGNVTIGSSQIDSVYAQGTVTLSGGGTVGSIYANKDVTISNGTVTLVDTLGNITISSGRSVTTAIAGGYINVTNGSVGTANAQGNITFSGSSATSLISGGNIAISNGIIGTAKAKGTITATGGSITNALAKGNITVTSNSVTMLSNTTEQTFYCNAEWWNDKVKTIQAKSFSLLKENCITDMTKVNTTSVPSVTFANDEPTNPTGSTKIVTTSTITVDANDYKSNANYIFSVDSNNRIKVKVQNVESQDGVDLSGEYYLARIRVGGGQYYVGNPQSGYLCAELQIGDEEYCKYDTNRTVEYIVHNQWYTEEIVTVTYDYHYTLKLFPNTSTTNENYVTYSSGTWNLTNYDNSNPSIAPGVLFFEGNVLVNAGNYVNTILATGNITANIPKVYSPNYAGASLVCNTSFGMPTNLCTSSTVLSKANNVGYIALLAGSYSGTTYVGGNIITTSNAEIYGNIIAGNKFNTNGATYVVGQIVAANLGASSASSSFNSKVTIDLTNVDKSTIDNSGSTETGTGSGTGSTSTTASIKWARYL